VLVERSRLKYGVLPLLLALICALAWLAASPANSEATKTYYCDNNRVAVGQWCGSDPVRRPYWLQVGCVDLGYGGGRTFDCRSSDYTYYDRYILCDIAGGWQVVVQAIEAGPKQRYSSSGCLIAGWYHPENWRGVIPFVTHLGGGGGTVHLKGWACWGGDPRRLIC
jgi:hypothetical protein